jgi:hypothetical protein
MQALSGMLILPEPSAQLLFAVLHQAADAIEAGGDRTQMLQAMQYIFR